MASLRTTRVQAASTLSGGLGKPVEGHVVGHDQMGTLADDQPVGDVHPALLQPVDLLQQHVRVDDHTVSYDTGRLRPEDPAWDQVEGELALLVQDGVARVVSAGEPGDDIGVLAEEVDDLPLSLVTPLRP